MFMHLAYYFMKPEWRSPVSNFQIKGMDDDLYEELKRLASREKRSVSQQAVFLFRDYLAKRLHSQNVKTPAQVLLDLAGSWEDGEDAKAVIARTKKARKNFRKLRRGF
jgi:predicted CopG family antitoxin